MEEKKTIGPRSSTNTVWIAPSFWASGLLCFAIKTFGFVLFPSHCIIQFLISLKCWLFSTLLSLIKWCLKKGCHQTMLVIKRVSLYPLRSPAIGQKCSCFCRAIVCASPLSCTQKKQCSNDNSQPPLQSRWWSLWMSGQWAENVSEENLSSDLVSGFLQASNHY